MSASPSRRPRDRAGGGSAVAKAPANLKPSKPLTPIPIFDKKPSSAGKENPTSKPRNVGPTQKPVIRPMSRVVDKTSGHAVGEPPRIRWSTSSAPRGRSSSPSDFTRVLLDMRKDRRVSTDRNNVKERRENDRVVASAGKTSNALRVSESVKQIKATDLGVNQIKVLKDCIEDGGRVGLNLEKKNGVCGVLDVKFVQSEKNVNKVQDLSKYNGHSDSSSELVNPNGCDKKVPKQVKVGNGIHLGQKKEVSEEHKKDPKEKEMGEEGLGDRGGNKYPSKLHEKLAFLEGKVKRIASDIKKTKEMLDMNNPDTSKVILTDIQEKISGIEKAMGNVTNPDTEKRGISNGVGKDELDVKMVDKGGIEKVDDSRSFVKGIEHVDNGKSLVKGLKSEDLEARLFPHHKLLKGRTTLKGSSACSQTVESRVGKPSCEPVAEDKSLSPIDENPIAQEFLASLNKEQTKVTMWDSQAGSEYCDAEVMDCDDTDGGEDSANVIVGNDNTELVLTTDETLDESDDQLQEIREGMMLEETEDNSRSQLNEIGCKATTAGWFVSEGESALLTHADGSCTFYDIVNCEVKAVFEPPAGVSPNMWRDCWIVRAPSADGCSERYVVAASAGNAMDSGFCSWDFYSKDVKAFYVEGGSNPTRTVLGPLPNNLSYRRTLCETLDPETRQWWYKPCGPLIISTASSQRSMRIHDIRDGQPVMKWDLQKPVLSMDYSSPLQWRNRGKVVVAEAEAISVWDVNSLKPEALLSVSTSGRKVCALHVNNTDAELGGGVRQRATSAEAEGNDGVFCTQDSVNILDFRHPTGVGLKISKLDVNVQSVFSRGDSVYLGCTNVRSGAKKQLSSEVQQFSMRKQRLFGTYALPECNAYSHQTAITQVWGNSNIVMGVCGRGLFVFDSLKDNELQCFNTEFEKAQKIGKIVGPDDLYSPCFDYSSSRALLISRDRPALWKHLT